MLTTLKSGFYLGVDCGTTKAEAVISDESGFVIGRAITDGGNPHNNRLDNLIGTIQRVVELAKADAQTHYPDRAVESFYAGCIGLAGLDTPGDHAKLREHVQNLPKGWLPGVNRLAIVNDGMVGLKAGTEKNWGICIRASTGSSCYGLGQSGQECKAGGWGYILGDQGSAYGIGRRLLRHVMREYDGRSAPTKISEVVLKHLGLHAPDELVSWVYQSMEVPVHEVADLAVLCNDPLLQDSVEVEDIVSRAIREIVIDFEAVIKQISLPSNQEIPVVLFGSIFQIRGRFYEQVVRGILNRTPNASVVLPNRSGAEGAIRVAQMCDSMELMSNDSVMVISSY